MDTTGSADLAVIPTEQELLPANIKRRGGGLTLDKLEQLLSDLRFQPDWRTDADTCDDYYDSHQLKGERLARMEALGIPPLITNLIAPVVNSVLGLEVKSRTDSRVAEADEAQEAPEEVVLALNVKLNEAGRESRADSAISEAYASMVKSGVGWVEVSDESDPYQYPYRCQAVHRNEIWWDWRAQRPDLSDARYLIRKRRYDKDLLVATMPEHADLIINAVENRFGSWQLDAEASWDTNLAMAAHVDRVTDIESSDWRDAERGRATVYEVWYRVWTAMDMLNLPNGRWVPHNPKDPMLCQAIKMGMVTCARRVTSEVRVAFYLGPHRLYDLPTPYPHRHFPYVPFFGYKESGTGIRYGMIRSMISPQDVVNSADAKMHGMLTSKRVVAHSDAIDKKLNTWRQVMDNIASPRSAVLLDPARRDAKFEVIENLQLSTQQFQRRMQAANDIESAGGVYKAMLGKEGAATSGVGINSLIEQSTVMLSELNDNYSFGRRQVNDLLFALVKRDLIDKEVRVPIKRNGKKEVITLNQRLQNPQTGQLEIANDIKAIEFKVTMSEVPNTASFKQQQLQVLTDVTRTLPPNLQAIFVPTILMLTDTPDKEEMAELIKKMVGVPKKLSDEEQAAADQAEAENMAKAAELQERLATANLALLEEKVRNLEASTQKVDAEKVAKLLEAMSAAMASGQIIVTTPSVAPIADELLTSAGYQDEAAQPLEIPGPEGGAPPVVSPDGPPPGPGLPVQPQDTQLQQPGNVPAQEVVPPGASAAGFDPTSPPQA